MVNQRIMEIMIEYGLKFGLNINVILLDETYNSDEYNQQIIYYFLQQWIETESIVQKVLNKLKFTNLLEIINNLYHFQGFEDIDKYSINDNNDNKSESKFTNSVCNNDYYNNNIYYDDVLESYNNYIETSNSSYYSMKTRQRRSIKID